MLVLRFGQCARLVSVAVFTAIAAFAIAFPAQADESSGGSHAAQSKRTTSFTNANSSAASGGATQGPNSAAYSSGFLYIPGAQTGLNVGGRVNVGKSHVYVPYYGNISNDPAHPGVQGVAGIAYGFRTWDISVLNGALGTTPQAPVPNVDTPKVNPALSLSIRF